MAKKNDVKLPFGIEWGFGIANFFMQLIVSMSASYFTFVMTDVFGLSTGIAATVNGVSSITGVASMFLFAALFQYTNLKWGRYRSWVMILTPCLVIGYVMMYIPWNVEPATWCVLLIIGYVFADLGASGIGTSCRSLQTVCSGSNQGRMLIVGRQNVLHNTARVVGGAIFVPLITLFGGSKTSPKGYTTYFLIFSCLTLLAYFWLAGQVKEYDKYDPNFRKNTANKVTIKDMLVALGSNRPLLSLFIGKVLQGCLTLSTQLGAYFFTYVCGDLSYYALYNTLSPFGGILGGLLSPWFSARFDKKKLFIASVAVQCFICLPSIALVYFLKGTVNPVFAVVMLSLGFCSNNISLTYFNTFWMDCAEYSFWKTGKDITPIVMTLMSLPAKLSRGVGASIGIALLGKSGYVAGQAQTKEALDMIVKLFTLAPALSNSVMFLFMIFGYNLSGEETQKIYDENTKKRAELKAAAAAAAAENK